MTVVAVNCVELTVTFDQCCNRLNATEYGDLKDKLRSPIMNIRNIIIRQTLSERFLEAFRFHVEQNEAYRKPPDMVMHDDELILVSILVYSKIITTEQCWL